MQLTTNGGDTERRTMGMLTPLRLPGETCQLLRCPACASPIILVEGAFACTNEACQGRFPVVDGVPILINEAASIFSIADVCRERASAGRNRSSLASVARRLVPETSANVGCERTYEQFADLLHHQQPRPRVLTIGGAIAGKGMERILTRDSIELVETDVVFGPRTALVCDAHDLPFRDGSFDGVIAQAVLEHVVDPYRCVNEIHRVLKHDGLVYVETPFMQQVHGGRYDFTRFSHLGHRRLFRRFEEIASGAVAGPGTVLAWSYQFFLLSFVEAPASRSLAKALARATSFWLKYFDPFLLRKPGALDAASAYYFLGRKSQRVLSDRELIGRYRGAE